MDGKQSNESSPIQRTKNQLISSSFDRVVGVKAWVFHVEDAGWKLGETDF
jgi:hypothetical protein